MTLYTLHIKSGISKITPEILNVFLNLYRYDASIYEEIKFEGNDPKIIHKYNVIEFHDLKEAQKAETILRKMYYCFIIREAEFDKTMQTTSHSLFQRI